MKRVLRALFVCCFSSALFAQTNLPEILDAHTAIVRFDPNTRKLVVSGPDLKPFFSTSPNNIQLLSWALAGGRSMKGGLLAKGDWLTCSATGRPGVFLIDTRRVSCRPAKGFDDLLEVFFDGGTPGQLKICDGSVSEVTSLIHCLAVANQKGGGFLRLHVKDNVVLGTHTCNWAAGHPSAEQFNIHAWHQTKPRLGEAHGVQLLSDLFILNPRTLRVEIEPWVQEQGFVVSPWQRSAISSIVSEAERHGKVIACSKELMQGEIKRGTQDFFCFALDLNVLPIADFSQEASESYEEESNSPESRRKRGGYYKY